MTTTIHFKQLFFCFSSLFVVFSLPPESHNHSAIPIWISRCLAESPAPSGGCKNPGSFVSKTCAPDLCLPTCLVPSLAPRLHTLPFSAFSKLLLVLFLIYTQPLSFLPQSVIFHYTCSCLTYRPFAVNPGPFSPKTYTLLPLPASLGLPLAPYKLSTFFKDFSPLFHNLFLCKPSLAHMC